MIFAPLASSSKGNAYIVSDRHTSILIEAGLSKRKLQQLAGFNLTGINACLISHEHKDHSASAADLSAMGIPVFMSQGTADALDLSGVTIICHGDVFTVGTMDIMPFNTFHDAAEPVGFLIRSNSDGDVLAFAIDTVNLAYRFPGVNILAIEANYDRGVLAMADRMPEKVKHRIQCSHMEIGTLCRYINSLDLSCCREIYLMHLSDAMSRERQFIDRVRMCAPAGTVIKACQK